MTEAPQDATEERSYAQLLDALSHDNPNIAAKLRMAESRRRERLAHYAGGARFRGLEQLLVHLHGAIARYESSATLAPFCSADFCPRIDSMPFST